METIKNFCVAVLCSFIIGILVLTSYLITVRIESDRHANMTIREIVLMLETENFVRKEWLENGGDKIYLTKKINDNNIRIKFFQKKIKDNSDITKEFKSEMNIMLKKFQKKIKNNSDITKEFKSGNTL